MDEITRGGAMYKHAWATLPKDRKRAISKAVQGGKVVTEETAIAIGYAVRQIRYSWTGYAGVMVLAAVIDKNQGSSPLKFFIPPAIALIGIYSYWRLFQSRRRNEDLLFSQDDLLDEDGDDEDEEPTDLGTEIDGPVAIERLEDEGGPVSEVAVPPLEPPPSAPQPQTPTAPESPAPPDPLEPPVPPAPPAPPLPTPTGESRPEGAQQHPPISRPR